MFDAEDGTDGGMPFAVYESKTQKKIFEDNAYAVWMWNPKLQPASSAFNDILVQKLGLKTSIGLPGALSLAAIDLKDEAWDVAVN